MIRRIATCLVALWLFARPVAALAEPTKAAIDDLVRTIDDDPDPLHNDYTPSVWKLTEAGLPGAAAVIDLLESPKELTRLHAQRVVEGVVMRRYGWVPGHGCPDRSDCDGKTRRTLKANGDYRWDGPAAERAAAVARWREWLKNARAEDEKARRP
jgi:hypothetical protein